MNKSYITAILSVTSLEFSNGSMAKKMSKPEYKATGKNIKSDHKSAKEREAIPSPITPGMLIWTEP